MSTEDLEMPPRPELLKFPLNLDSRGLLISVEGDSLPFPIRRVFFITDVPQGAVRGGHGHLACSELIVAATGAFTVATAGDGTGQTFRLDDPSLALYLPPGEWCELRDFTSNAVALVLASHEHNPDDHVPGRLDG